MSQCQGQAKGIRKALAARERQGAMQGPGKRSLCWSRTSRCIIFIINPSRARQAQVGAIMLVTYWLGIIGLSSHHHHHPLSSLCQPHAGGRRRVTKHCGSGEAQVRLRPGVLRRAKETSAVRVSLYGRGKAVPVCGYGEGVYYRLGRQPLWLIRQRGHTKTDGSLCPSCYWWNSAVCALGEWLGGSGYPIAYQLFT